jgi:hypothetical protein
MSEFLAALLAIFKAVPMIKSAFEDLISLYVNSQISSMKRENRDAIKKAIEKQDQRDLENIIGSPHAGKPSGHEGTTIVDTLPGVD